MSNIVLFGAGKIADEVYHYLTYDSDHKVVAFTIDGAYIKEKEKFGLPIIPFEDLLKKYPPDDYKMFVATGYQNLNRLRAEKYNACKKLGYTLISYVCSQAANFGKVDIGDNCLALENAVIQPCTRIGSNVFIWSGNHIGHHSQVCDHCYLAGQVIIGGSSVVESHCFIGMNATIGHEIRVGKGCFIGANVRITKNVDPGSVFIEPDTPKFRLDAESFLKMTKMK